MFFLELSCFFNDPTDIGSLISGSFAFSKTSLNIWKFMIHVLLNPGLKNFEHYFASMWDERNCAVVWTFFGTRDQTANIRWIIENAREFQENIYFCFIGQAKAFDWVDHNKLWKILQEMGIPDHLTCPLRSLYAGQEATVRTGHGTMNWFQIGKGVCQGCILSPCLFNLYAEYLIQNAWLNEAQAGIKIARRIMNNLRYVDDSTLMQKEKKN